VKEGGSRSDERVHGSGSRVWSKGGEGVERNQRVRGSEGKGG